jgi:hypothetical protein
VKRDHGDAATTPELSDTRLQKIFQLDELPVDRDPQRLKCQRGRIDPVTPRLFD